MPTSLRILLVAVVAATPLVVGLQRSDADESAPMVVGADDASPLDGSPQDDAGTLIEESGEDDTDPDESRLDHAWAQATRAPAADAPGRFSRPLHRHPRGVERPRSAGSRGPPSRR